jgi:Spy/CpxP family protein refolding chaperone
MSERPKQCGSWSGAWACDQNEGHTGDHGNKWAGGVTWTEEQWQRWKKYTDENPDWNRYPVGWGIGDCGS